MKFIFILSVIFFLGSFHSIRPIDTPKGAIWGWVISRQDTKIASEFPSDLTIDLDNATHQPVWYPRETENYTGAFFFSDVEPGVYSIKSSATGLVNGLVKDIMVSADSLTFVVMSMDKERGSKKPIPGHVTWKVRNVAPSMRGSIEGFVSGRMSQQKYPIEGASVNIVGTLYHARTDSTGYYHIDNVISGEYTVSSRFYSPLSASERFHMRATAKSVTITEAETTILDMELKKVAVGVSLKE